MFGQACSHNKWLIDSFSLVFQIVFVFAFLTIFFFAYVVKVEKEGFESQMKYIVDQLLTTDIEKELLTSVKGKISTEEIVSIISGIIDGIKYQAQQDSTSSVDSVNVQNNKIRTKAFINLSCVTGALILITIVLLIVGYCIPIRSYVTEALWVVLFVGLTEVVFLQVIAKNYISADPNKVKSVIGAEIEKWICTNKKSMKC